MSVVYPSSCDASGKSIKVENTASGENSYFTGHKVGIGTTSPSTRSILDLGPGENTGYDQKLLIIDTGTARAGWGHVSYEDRLFFPSDGHMSFGAISTTDGETWAEKMRIENGGNVGIGNTSPGAKLEIDGTADETTALAIKKPINAPNTSWAEVRGVNVEQTLKAIAVSFQCRFWILGTVEN